MSNDLIDVKVLNPIEVFMGDKPTLENQIKLVMDEVEAFEADVSTSKGRDDCRSLASKVTRSKTALDALGKDYLAKENERLSHINPLRKAMREKLEQVAKDVRKPLTEWEEVEAKRESDIQEKLLALQAMAITTISDISFLEKGLADIQETVIDETWGKVQMQAELAKKNALDHHVKRIADLKQQAKEREELETFRREKADREAKEASDKAESERQEREMQIADDAAKKAEQEAEAAKEQAEQAEKRRVQDLADAEAKAEQDKKEAAERAERDKQAAVEAEQKRVEDEMQREKDEESRRAANKKHNAAVNNKAKDALIVAGLSDQAATQAVTAIAKGMIPNVTIRY